MTRHERAFDEELLHRVGTCSYTAPRLLILFSSRQRPFECSELSYNTCVAAASSTSESDAVGASANVSTSSAARRLRGIDNANVQRKLQSSTDAVVSTICSYLTSACPHQMPSSVFLPFFNFLHRSP